MLSIIIPTLNEEKLLPGLLNEILKQEFFGDYEIIVADGGSQDKTTQIAKELGCLIVKGGLPAKGRNEGAKIAKGEKILFIDADTIFLPNDFLTKLINEFKKRNLDIASFAVYPKGNLLDRTLYRIYNFWVDLTQSFLPHATHAILVKKELHQKIGGFDENIKLAEDQSYARIASKFGKFGFIKIGYPLISARRYERDGRTKTYIKYFLAGLYMFFLGDIKSDIFNYRYNKHLYNEKKKN